MRAPAARTSSARASWRGRSRMQTVRSATFSPLARAIALRLRADRRVDVDDVGALGPDDQLLHVEDGAGVVHGAPLGDREHRDGVRHALGGQGRAVDRVDGDVALGPDAVADALAVEEHRGVVLLALADDDDAVHRDAPDELAHGVDGDAVGAVLVAAAHPAGRGHRGSLGDPHELEGQVAVRDFGRARVGSHAASVSTAQAPKPPRRPGREAAADGMDHDWRVTSPDVQPTGRPNARLRQTAWDMVRSMAVVLVVVFVIVLLAWRPEPEAVKVVETGSDGRPRRSRGAVPGRRAVGPVRGMACDERALGADGGVAVRARPAHRLRHAGGRVRAGVASRRWRRRPILDEQTADGIADRDAGGGGCDAGSGGRRTSDAAWCSSTGRAATVVSGQRRLGRADRAGRVARAGGGCPLRS